ncbi:hypothetical protein OEW28_13960 [Defluviimonas sp. WL0002]|uniref:DUF2244 domain-containing protein n=1 Tax=Albidovulum marisflavi TaxID=2984159 RepID=A0ABT2ZF13_9RHOB|nr:hypothetical protein [Defluviimonas sp. WL0002]MCV2869735.1 hypothetical protein [Defluviimonas sp. WL0002]
MTMLRETFEYRDQSRTPASYLALGAAMASAYLMHTLGLPGFHQWLAILFVVVVLWRIADNSIHGFRLSDEGLEFFEGRYHRNIALEEIASVTIYQTGHKPGEGETRCILNLYSGDRLSLPGAERFGTRRLVAEFAKLGLPTLF